jgi:hypothetical protein
LTKKVKIPLEGVTVLITPCDCGGISNTSGIFSKRLQKGAYNLSIEYLGYGTQTLEVDLIKIKQYQFKCLLRKSNSPK